MWGAIEMHFQKSKLFRQFMLKFFDTSESLYVYIYIYPNFSSSNNGNPCKFSLPVFGDFTFWGWCQ